MYTRPSSQARILFDAIFNATTSDKEELVIRLLTAIAATDDNTKNSEAITVGYLLSGVFDDQHDDMSVLMAAAKVGSERIVRCIIDMISFYYKKLPYDYNFNFIDRHGNTALMFAAQNGNLTILKILMATGKCDPTIHNAQWKNAIDLAKAGNHQSVVDALIPEVIKINQRRETIFASARQSLGGASGRLKYGDASEAETKRNRGNPTK